MLAFQIGGDTQDSVRVDILQDNEDGWLSARVTVNAGEFRGSYPASFNSWAFSDFASQLEKLHRTVSGSAVFTSYERQLELELSCNAVGHIVILGEAMDYAGTGNKLIFRLHIDQSYVPSILGDLRKALEEYPARAV